MSNYFQTPEDIFKVLETGNFIHPPDDKFIEVITPWRRAMRRILWGVVLIALLGRGTMLDMVFPAVGVVLLYLGFRSLRQENRWFGIGYGLTLIWMVWMLVRVAVGCSSRAAGFYASLPVMVIEYLFDAVTLVMLLCIRQGIQAIQKAQDQNLETRHITLAMVLYVVMQVLFRMENSSLMHLLGIVTSALLAFLLYKTFWDVGEAGYAIQPKPVILSDLKVWLIAAGVALVCVAAGGQVFQIVFLTGGV